jgi:hypothetical protein
MTDDLKEALALAGVEFLMWHQRNGAVRERDAIYINLDGTSGYVHEPTVRLSGHALPISAICKRAESLSGPLPLLVKWIFDAIPDLWAYGIEVHTYPDAAGILQLAIKQELEDQESHPIPGPCIRDIIRQDERERVCAAIQQLIVARPYNQRSKFTRLAPDEWREVVTLVNAWLSCANSRSTVSK